MARLSASIAIWAVLPSLASAYVFHPGPLPGSFVMRGGSSQPHTQRQPHTQAQPQTQQNTGRQSGTRTPGNQAAQQQQQTPFPFASGLTNPFIEALTTNQGRFNATTYNEFVKEQQDVMRKVYQQQQQQQQQGGSGRQQQSWESLAETLAESLRRYSERVEGQSSPSAAPSGYSAPPSTESLRRELEAKNAQLAEMRQATQKWDDANRALTRRVLEAESRTQSLGSSIKQLEVENARLRSKFAGAQGPATQQLLQELQNGRVREAELRARLQSSKRSRDGLQAEVLKLSQALQMERASAYRGSPYDRGTQALRERDVTIQQLTAKLAAYENKRLSVDEKVSSQEKNNEFLRREMQTYLREIEEYRIQVEGLKGELDGKTKALQNLRRAVGEASAALS